MIHENKIIGGVFVTKFADQSIYLDGYKMKANDDRFKCELINQWIEKYWRVKK